MTLGSLFSGIGGLELGLEAALGARTVWQVEMDPYARRVLRKHWPRCDRTVRDVRNAGAATLPRVDLVCGGFPCQDISVAGKGAGLAGARSGLWHEFHRVVCEMGPRVVVVENVPALAARGLDVVLGALAELGYDAEWGVLSAAAVGAPHLRKRLFIIAWRNVANADREGQLQPQRAIGALGGRAGDGSRQGSTVADADGAGQRQQRRAESATPQHAAAQRCRGWAAEPNVGRVAHGVPARAHRLHCLGNAVVPAVAFEIGLRVREVLAAEVMA